jgi:hypothetical protein
MNARKVAVVIATTMLWALTAIADSDTPPALVAIPKTEAPAEIPRGAKVTCLLDNELTSSDTCEVIRWQGCTYWVFSDDQNADRMEVGAYDASGNLVASWSRFGARYLRQIVVDENRRTVTLWGQAHETIVLSWDQLLITTSDCPQ